MWLIDKLYHFLFTHNEIGKVKYVKLYTSYYGKDIRYIAADRYDKYKGKWVFHRHYKFSPEDWEYFTNRGLTSDSAT